MVYLDTHVVVWLYMGDLTRISPDARNLINKNELRISPIICLELQYLKEIGRLTTDGKLITDFLENTIQLQICDMPFQDVIMESQKLTWTRDPFDRIIVGHSIAAKSRLITKDRKIQSNYVHAVW